MFLGCTSILGDFSTEGGAVAGDAGPTAGDDASPDVGAPLPTGDAAVAPAADATAHVAADGSAEASVAPAVDAGADTGAMTPTCTGTLVACGTACVDLTSSPTNCGACGHDCGGGACESSRCQPYALVPSIEPPTTFAIDSKSIYFAQGGTITSCPIAGCAFGSTQIVSGFTQVNQIAVGADYLLFIAYSDTGLRVGGAPQLDFSVYSCPKGPCPSPVAVTGTVTSALSNMVLAANNLLYIESGCSGLCRPGSSFSNVSQCLGFSPSGCDGGVITIQSGDSPIAADTANVYFSFDEDAGADAASVPTLASCPLGAPCAVPQALRSAVPDSTELVAFSGSLLFNGEIEFTRGESPVDFFSCPTADCSNPASLASLSDAVASFAVDTSGIYLAAGSEIYECPPAGCGADPMPIATGQSAPQTVLSDPQFVYWIDGDQTASDGGVIADSGGILRVAK
jgi:hypothetical protein